MTGRRMDLPRIARAGQARARALKRANEDLVDEVLDELEAAGELANFKLAAKLSGISRSTLYRRLEDRARERAAGFSAPVDN